MLVFQAELYAILTSASLLCNSTNRSITICSDSQAALKSWNQSLQLKWHHI